MKRWDTIDSWNDEWWEMTHPWLFHGGTPEIIENAETIRLEKRIKAAQAELFKAFSEVVAELFPPKEPVPPKQEVLLQGPGEVKWQDH